MQQPTQLAADVLTLADSPVVAVLLQPLALAGSECPACGQRCFPRRTLCMQCGSGALRDVALANRGRLYSHSAVHVSSRRPVPYTIGYVDLDDGTRVLADLQQVGEDCALDVPVVLQAADDGRWWFAPDPESGHARIPAAAGEVRG